MPYVAFAQAVEEVTVTATRQAESLQDIALSVQAIDGDDLMTQHIESATDLAETTVGIKTANGIGSGFGISIRGLNMPTIGSATIAPGQTSINGHVITATAFAEVGFLDAERLEILEGPQGTLYGRNTTTGLINLISARPGAGNYLTASYGEDGYTMLKGAYDFDVTNDLVGRVAVSSFTKDGTVMNVNTGNKVDDRDAYGARLSLDYTINDNNSLAFNFETYKIDDNRLNLGAASCQRDSFFGCSPMATNLETNINNPILLSGTVNNTFDQLAFINPGSTISALADQYVGANANISNNIDAINKTVDAKREQELDFAQLEYSTSFDVAQGGIDVRAKWTNSVNDYYHLDDNDHSNATVEISNAIFGNPNFSPALGQMTIASLPTHCVGTLTNVTFAGSTECSTVNTEENQWEVNMISDFDGPFNFTAGAYVVDNKAKNAYNIQTTGYLLLTDFGNHPLAAMFGGALDGYGGQAAYATIAGTLASPLGLDAAAGGPGPLGTALATDLTADPTAGLTGTNTLAAGATLAAAIQTACEDLNPAFSVPGHAAEGFNPCVKDMPPEAGGLISDQRTNRKDKAIYGELYFDLNDDMRLTLGARYMNDRFRSRSQQGLSDSAGAYSSAGTACLGTDYDACYAAASQLSSDSSEATTYKGAFQYFYDQGMAYASITQGHRAGGANPDTTLYAAAKSTSYEIGTKNILMDGALKMNATLFRHEEDGAHYSVIRVNSAYVEPHDLVHQGLQLDTQLFLSDSTILSAQALFTDSTFSTSTTGTGRGPGGVVVSQGSRSIDPHNPTQSATFNNVTGAEFITATQATAAFAAAAPIIQGQPGFAAAQAASAYAGASADEYTAALMIYGATADRIAGNQNPVDPVTAAAVVVTQAMVDAGTYTAAELGDAIPVPALTASPLYLPTDGLFLDTETGLATNFNGVVASCSIATGQNCATAAFTLDDNGTPYMNPIGLAAPICVGCSEFVELGGNQVPGVSDMEAVVGITQLFEGFGGTGAATLSYSYKDEFFGDIYNNERFKVGAQEYFDFNAQYQPNDGDWYVNLWAKNLADKRQVTSAQRTSNLQGQIIFLTFSEGIRAGLDVGINF